MTSLRSVLVAAAVSATASVTQAPLVYTITGACDANDYIDGLQFVLEGRSLSGAPFYKAMGHEYYLYHDPDCTASGTGTPRWIIDVERPSKEKNMNLDGDSSCASIAYVDSKDISRPLATGLWKMTCAGVEQPQFLILAAHSSTTPCPLDGEASGNPKKSTTKSAGADGSSMAESEEKDEHSTASTTEGSDEKDEHSTASTTEASTPSPSTTGEDSSTTAPSTMPSLVLSGACECHDTLNGAIFDYMGTTADGSPYYKARDVEEYIYYDSDCDGSGDSNVARWVLDDSAPSLTSLEDHDDDQECNYHARLNLESSVGGPPSSGAWSMYCGASGWEEVPLTLTEVEPSSSQTDDVLCASAQRVRSAFVSVFVLVAAQLIRSFAV